MKNITLDFDYIDCFGDSASKEGAEILLAEDGVVRWASNQSVPPSNMMEGMAKACPEISVEASEAAKAQDFRKLRDSMRNSKPDPIQMAEMRNELGPGPIVNIITGERYE